MALPRTTWRPIATKRFRCASPANLAEAGLLGSCTNLHFLQLSVDRLLKTSKSAIVQALAVYKNRRRSPDTGLFSVIYIPGDQILDCRVLGICIQSLRIKANLLGYLLHFCFIDTLEVFKNFLMVLPKFALPVGCQRNG
jgi:hypothetical protein